MSNDEMYYANTSSELANEVVDMMAERQLREHEQREAVFHALESIDSLEVHAANIDQNVEDLYDKISELETKLKKAYRRINKEEEQRRKSDRRFQILLTIISLFTIPEVISIFQTIVQKLKEVLTSIL